MKKLIFIALVLASCGTRKTEKNSTELHLQTKDTTAVAAAAKQTVNAGSAATATKEQSNVYVAAGGTATPIDPDKPMKLTDPDGRTTTLENGIYTWHKEQGITTNKETKTVRDTIARDNVLKLNINAGNQAKADSIARQAGTERVGAGSNIEFWIGITILIGFLTWLIFKHFKDENDKNTAA